jgi:hypothetical protein
MSTSYTTQICLVIKPTLSLLQTIAVAQGPVVSISCPALMDIEATTAKCTKQHCGSDSSNILCPKTYFLDGIHQHWTYGHRMYGQDMERYFKMTKSRD